MPNRPCYRHFETRSLAYGFGCAPEGANDARGNPTAVEIARLRLDDLFSDTGLIYARGIECYLSSKVAEGVGGICELLTCAFRPTSVQNQSHIGGVSYKFADGRHGAANTRSMRISFGGR